MFGFGLAFLCLFVMFSCFWLFVAIRYLFMYSLVGGWFFVLVVVVNSVVYLILFFCVLVC